MKKKKIESLSLCVRAWLVDGGHYRNRHSCPGPLTATPFGDRAHLSLPHLFLPLMSDAVYLPASSSWPHAHLSRHQTVLLPGLPYKLSYLIRVQPNFESDYVRRPGCVIFHVHLSFQDVLFTTVTGSGGGGVFCTDEVVRTGEGITLGPRVIFQTRRTWLF